MSQGGPPVSFRTNVNRMKTKRWVEAKRYDYDGDDWGDADEYDEYDDPEHAEAAAAANAAAAAAVKPTGLRQDGQGAGPPAGQASRPGPSASSPVDRQPQPPYARGEHERSSSFGRGDDRAAFSGPPPMQQPHAPSPIVSPMRTAYGSGATDPSSPRGRGPPTPGGGRGAPVNPGPRPPADSYRASPTATNAPADRRDFSSSSAVPQPLNMPPRSTGHTPEPRPSSSTSTNPQGAPHERTDSSSKGAAFIRPADIYKRMQEEKDKQRLSQESSRTSTDAVAPEKPKSRERSPSKLNEGSDPARTAKTVLAPPADRKHEYGSDALLSPSKFEDLKQTRRTSGSPVLPEISGFGDDFAEDFGSSFMSTGAETTGPRPSEPLKAKEPSPAEPTASKDQVSTPLQHTTSQGFRSAVEQAFDQPAVPETPSSTSGSNVARSNSETTSVISPIISRGPSDAQPNQPSLVADTKGTRITPIAEEPNSPVVTPAERGRSVADEKPPNFIPGYRRDTSTPSPGNSPARKPGVESARGLRQPQAVEVASLNQPESSAPTAAGAEAAVAPLQGVGSEVSQKEPASAPRESAATSQPSSRAGSPSKGRVRDLAEKINSESNSRRNSQDSGTGGGESPTKAQRPQSGRLENFRPTLPGGWNSYTTNASPGSEQAPQGPRAESSKAAVTAPAAPAEPAATMTATPALQDESAVNTLPNETSRDASQSGTAVAAKSRLGTATPGSEGKPHLGALPTDAAFSSIMHTPQGMADGHDLSKDTEYFNNVPSLHTKSQPDAAGMSAETSTPVKPPNLSTESSPSDQESDRLRKQLFRELSPQQETPPRTEALWARNLPVEPAAPTALNVAQQANKIQVEEKPRYTPDLGSAPVPVHQQPKAAVRSAQTDASPQRKFSWEASSEPFGDDQVDDQAVLQEEPGALEPQITTQHPMQAPSQPLQLSQPPNTLIQGQQQPPQSYAKDHAQPGALEKRTTDPASHFAGAFESNQADDVVKGLYSPTFATGATSQPGPVMDSDEYLNDDMDVTSPVHFTAPGGFGTPAQGEAGSFATERWETFREVQAVKAPEDRLRHYATARQNLAKQDHMLFQWIQIAGSTGSQFVPSPQPRVDTSLSRPAGAAFQPSPGSAGPAMASVSNLGASPSSAKLSSQSKGKELLHSAGVFGGKANTRAKGLFAKGRNKLRNATSDKASQKPPSAPTETRRRPLKFGGFGSSQLRSNVDPTPTPPKAQAQGNFEPAPTQEPSSLPPNDKPTVANKRFAMLTANIEPGALPPPSPSVASLANAKSPLQSPQALPDSDPSHHTHPQSSAVSAVSSLRSQAHIVNSSPQPSPYQASKPLPSPLSSLFPARGTSLPATPPIHSPLAAEHPPVLSSGNVAPSKASSRPSSLSIREYDSIHEPEQMSIISANPPSPEAEKLRMPPRQPDFPVKEPQPVTPVQEAHKDSMDVVNLKDEAENSDSVESPAAIPDSPQQIVDVVPFTEHRQESRGDATPTQKTFATSIPTIATDLVDRNSRISSGGQAMMPPGGLISPSQRSSLALGDIESKRFILTTPTPDPDFRLLPLDFFESPQTETSPGEFPTPPKKDAESSRILSHSAAASQRAAKNHLSIAVGQRPFSFIKFDRTSPQDFALTFPLSPQTEEPEAPARSESMTSEGQSEDDGGILAEKELESAHPATPTPRTRPASGARPFEEPDIGNHPAFRGDADSRRNSQYEDLRRGPTPGSPALPSPGVRQSRSASAMARLDPASLPPPPSPGQHSVFSRPSKETNRSTGTEEKKKKKRNSLFSSLSAQSERSKRTSKTPDTSLPIDPEPIFLPASQPSAFEQRKLSMDSDRPDKEPQRSLSRQLLERLPGPLGKSSDQPDPKPGKPRKRRLSGLGGFISRTVRPRQNSRGGPPPVNTFPHIRSASQASYYDQPSTARERGSSFSQPATLHQRQQSYATQLSLGSQRSGSASSIHRPGTAQSNSRPETSQSTNRPSTAEPLNRPGTSTSHRGPTYSPFPQQRSTSRNYLPTHLPQLSVFNRSQTAAEPAGAPAPASAPAQHKRAMSVEKLLPASLKVPNSGHQRKVSAPERAFTAASGSQTLPRQQRSGSTPLPLGDNPSGPPAGYLKERNTADQGKSRNGSVPHSTKDQSGGQQRNGNISRTTTDPAPTGLRKPSNAQLSAEPEPSQAPSKQAANPVFDPVTGTFRTPYAGRDDSQDRGSEKSAVRTAYSQAHAPGDRKDGSPYRTAYASRDASGERGNRGAANVMPTARASSRERKEPSPYRTAYSRRDESREKNEGTAVRTAYSAREKSRDREKVSTSVPTGSGQTTYTQVTTTTTTTTTTRVQAPRNGSSSASKGKSAARPRASSAADDIQAALSKAATGVTVVATPPSHTPPQKGSRKDGSPAASGTPQRRVSQKDRSHPSGTHPSRHDSRPSDPPAPGPSVQRQGSRREKPTATNSSIPPPTSEKSLPPAPVFAADPQRKGSRQDLPKLQTQLPAPRSRKEARTTPVLVQVGGSLNRGLAGANAAAGRGPSPAGSNGSGARNASPAVAHSAPALATAEEQRRAAKKAAIERSGLEAARKSDDGKEVVLPPEGVMRSAGPGAAAAGVEVDGEIIPMSSTAYPGQEWRPDFIAWDGP